MFGFRRKNQELETILNSLNANAANNYKDAAQDDLERLAAAFDRLSSEGKLNAKQKAEYSGIITSLKSHMKNYTHVDQKPDYTGFTGNNGGRGA